MHLTLTIKACDLYSRLELEFQPTGHPKSKAQKGKKFERIFKTVKVSHVVDLLLQKREICRELQVLLASSSVGKRGDDLIKLYS